MKKMLIILLLLLLVACSAAAETVENVVKMSCIVRMPDVIREGSYTGQTVNGVPHGFGLFETTNSEGVNWHYIGEWVNGSMSGEGGLYWDNGKNEVGTFQNGYLVSGKACMTPQKIYGIDYLNAESGCVNITEYRQDGTISFDGCVKIESASYHKGTIYTNDEKVFFSGEFGEGFNWRLIYTD